MSWSRLSFGSWLRTWTSVGSGLNRFETTLDTASPHGTLVLSALRCRPAGDSLFAAGDFSVVEAKQKTFCFHNFKPQLVSYSPAEDRRKKTVRPRQPAVDVASSIPPSCT
jgi:hypothetical protein